MRCTPTSPHTQNQHTYTHIPHRSSVARLDLLQMRSDLVRASRRKAARAGGFRASCSSWWSFPKCASLVERTARKSPTVVVARMSIVISSWEKVQHTHHRGPDGRAILPWLSELCGASALITSARGHSNFKPQAAALCALFPHQRGGRDGAWTKRLSAMNAAC